MKKILFVCLGNICRSPMAEAVFKAQLKQAGLDAKYSVASRATSRFQEGNPPHQGTQDKLNEHQIKWDTIRSEQIQPTDFQEFDLIIGMDHQNVQDLKAIAPDMCQDKIHLFLEVLPESKYQEVPDPYYTGDFELTYQLVNEGSSQWLVNLESN